jgi:leucine dehydrogenase
MFITDLNGLRAKSLAKRLKAEYVAPEKIFDVSCDIFAPCALGGILNDETIPKLRCKIVAGGANNQLLDEQKHTQLLIDRDIFYAPDFAINAGGLISVANELEGHGEQRALMQAEGIYGMLKNIYRIAREEKVPTTTAANRLAEIRIASLGHIKGIYSGTAKSR